MDWKKESEMFNKTANYYDKFRPSYPKEIINTIIYEANIKRGSKLVEIGAGSGKATELFIGKCFDILCIEPGEDLVKIGNKRFESENVIFVNSRFEDFNFTEQNYDMIFSAQAFHWVAQPQGYEKCAKILKDKGHLAVFWNMYITFDNPLDDELLSISKKYGGFADFLSENECEVRINSIISQIEGSGLFCNTKTIRKLWYKKYTADEYFGFILTGNRFVQKSETEKQKAYKDIINLANKNNGFIERPYLCVSYISQKI